MRIRIDITGKRFGKLVAQYPVRSPKTGKLQWHCQCDCGRVTNVDLQHLKTGNTKSCGYCTKVRYDLTGKHFGRLVVTGRTNRKSTSGNYYWACQCDCGRKVDAESYLLRHGKVRSCGCLRKEKSAERLKNNRKISAQMGAKDAFRDSNGNPIQSVVTSSRNQSGVVGVSFNSSGNKWVARMMVNGKMVLNESYDEFNDAVAARRKAELKYLK